MTGCGTAAGYKAHRRRGEDACDGCKEANAAAKQTYKEAAKTGWTPPPRPIPRCPLLTQTTYHDRNGPWTTPVGQCVLDHSHPPPCITPPNRP